MVKEALIEIFARDLRKLKEELNLYADEKTIWVVKDGITNSAGNLCLHLTGNLHHFIGAILGKNGYVRDRDAEFSLKNIPREELLKDIDAAIQVITSTLNHLQDEDLTKDFPIEKQGKIETTAHMLIHLLGHLSYHLGQINYHRRLIEN